MNVLFNNEDRTALVHGIIAGALVLVLNSIGHDVFDAPAIPFVYGVASAFGLVITVVRLLITRYNDYRHHI
jgi:hypothetical protein